MTKRLLAALLPGLCALGCHATPAPERPAANTTVVHSAPASNDTLGMLFVQLERVLAPVQTWRTTSEKVLRPDSGTVRADSTLLRMRGELQLTIARLEKEFDSPQLEKLIYPSGVQSKADSLSAFLAARGIWTRRSEGDAYFQASDASVLKWLGRFVTPATAEFLRMATEAQHVPVADDAALMISLDELESRLLAAEGFLAKYPRAAAHDQVYSVYRQYLAMYLAGIDNSPVFDFRSHRLLPELRARYERYAAKQTSTESGRVVAEYLRLLKANNYTLTPKVEAFHRKLWDAIPY